MARQKKVYENAAYTKEYEASRQKLLQYALRPEFLQEQDEYYEQDWKRTIGFYQPPREEKTGLKWACTENRVYSPDGRLRLTYYSPDDHPFFCTPVQHSNGHLYLVYKEDLYGFSVADVESGATFRYIPALSFSGKGETFIATSCHYNPLNDVFAVEGCYWACPRDVFLFEAKKPLNGFSRGVNLHYVLKGDYDVFDEVAFDGWEGTSIRVKGDNLDTGETESILLPQAQYEAAYDLYMTP